MYLGGSVFILLVSILLIIATIEIGTAYSWPGSIKTIVSIISVISLSLVYSHMSIYWMVLSVCISSITFFFTYNQIASTLFGYVFYLGGVLPGAIAFTKLFNINVNSIIVLILLLQFYDAFGIIVGRKFGRTKLFPKLSPGKSLEGVMAGVLGIVIAIGILHSFIPILRGTSLRNDLFLGVFFVISGTLGDLAYSKIKRSRKIKDFGTILSGHGGILDRFDSVLYSTPFYLILIEKKWLII